MNLRVRFAETDQMGIAHHASYVVWLEAARIEWLRERGLSYRDIEAAGISLAVTQVAVNYKRSALFDDVLEVTASLILAKSRLFAFSYTLLRPADASLIATATTHHVSVNQAGRPSRLPAVWLEQLSKHVAS
jgi:acyl-CoA thioester hydrolase